MTTSPVSRTSEQTKSYISIGAAVGCIVGVLAMAVFTCLGANHIGPFDVLGGSNTREALEIFAGLPAGAIAGTALTYTALKVADAARFIAKKGSEITVDPFPKGLDVDLS